MAYYPATPFVQQFTNDAGVPLSGGTITAYLAGTTTPTNMFVDDAGTSAGSVITLNARGEPQVSGNTVVIWLNDAVTYKFVLKDASGVSKWTIDDIGYTTISGQLAAGVLSRVVNSIAALKALDKTQNSQVFVTGYYTAGDGGGGHYWYDSSDTTSSDNGGSIIVAADGARWKLIYRFWQNVYAFGQNANNLGRGLQIGGGDASYGSDGVLLAPDGHSTWLRFQPSKNESPIEVNVYNSAAQGIATATNGTNQVTRVSGTAFTSTWIGKRFYLGTSIYLVSAVTDASHLTVTQVGGGAVSFSSTFNETFHIAYTSGAGICSTNGTAVTRVSGDPFIPFASVIYKFLINGAPYTVSSITDINSLILTGSAGTQNNVSYTFEANINDQLSSFRLQKMLGTDEENLSIIARYDGYLIQSQYAGSGQYRKIVIGSGEITPGTLARQIVAQPNGEITIGGDYGYEAIRVLNQAGAVNRLETLGALPGARPVWRARGSDTNVGIGFDTQGTGAARFTSHSLANVEFEIFGVGGTSWLGVASDTLDQPILSANGASANIDIKLAPKGTGQVWVGGWTSNADAAVNGYITVKDSSGNIRKLATIA